MKEGCSGVYQPKWWNSWKVLRVKGKVCQIVFVGCESVPLLL